MAGSESGHNRFKVRSRSARSQTHCQHGFRPTAGVGLAKPTAGVGPDPLPAWIWPDPRPAWVLFGCLWPWVSGVWVLGLPMWVCGSGSLSVAVGLRPTAGVGPSWSFVAVGLRCVGLGSAGVGLWQWVSVCGRGYWVSGVGLW